MRKILLILLVIIFITPAFAKSSYSIVIDAGSSGSRLHFFKYTTGKGNIPVITEEISPIKIKPGLSSYATNPKGAAESLKPLLDAAIQQTQKQSIDPQTVSFILMATAGMRLLPTETQNQIYTEITNYIKTNYSFSIKTIETISGKMEGIYAWLEVNYLS